MTGIYFHIPFCARKCPYCDFFSAAYHKQTAEAYVGAILRNIAAYPVHDTVDTLYFGGGTPSLLSVRQISAILDTCHRQFHMAQDMEITLEFNPTGERSAYLHDLYTIGVNRLSIGTQSFSDTQLHNLGRTHSAADGQRTVLAAYDAGFTNISCDLMLACPEQTEAVLSETLHILAALPITHVSAYLLQIEEGTPLSRNTALLAQCPDDDTAADRYLQAVRTLTQAGFVQYEVSSFAKSGYESRHNLKYWLCEPYLGIGAGAHSCFDGRRFSVPKDITAFCKRPVQKETLISPTACDAEERLMLGLRLSRGVAVTQLSRSARKQLPQLLQAGYIHELSAGRVALTAEGFVVSNAVIA